MLDQVAADLFLSPCLTKRFTLSRHPGKFSAGALPSDPAVMQGGMNADSPGSATARTAKTAKGKRALEKKEPKEVCTLWTLTFAGCGSAHKHASMHVPSVQQTALAGKFA